MGALLYASDLAGIRLATKAGERTSARERIVATREVLR